MTAHSADADRLLKALVEQLHLTFPEAMRLKNADVQATQLIVEDKDGQLRCVPLPTRRLQQLAHDVRADRTGGHLFDTGGMTSRHARQILRAA
jgi:hypothetical protein